MGNHLKEKTISGVFCSNKYFNYAGTHLLVEFWKAENLDDIGTVEMALKSAVRACGATLLDIKLHYFSPFEGVSAVALLQESHISIHTWPEIQYAAIDIFVCGNLDPYKAIPVLKRFFNPKKMQMMDVKRGILE